MTTLAISPCPNDTFAFYGLLHDKVGHAVPETVTYADIEELNRMCLAGEVDFCKISFHAYALVRDRYTLLEAGSALGFGCGPLVVARPGMTAARLASGRIAIPGQLTTATLLFKLWLGPGPELVPMPFDRIMPAVAAGQVDAGLIIHESRFTFQKHGLISLVDLGAWWEEHSGHPIPLGGIVARRDLPEATITAFDAALARSIDYAHQHWDELVPYMQRHAQEMEPDVMKAHVELYVNRFTRALGTQGRTAVDFLVNEMERLNHNP